MRILVFGDSIGEGYYDYEKGGWVNRLKIKLFDDNFDILNLSISGYTSEEVLHIIEKYLTFEESIFIFAIGINDSALEFGKNIISKITFKKNLQKLINLSKEEKNIKNIFFITNINCDESKTNPVIRNDIYYKNKIIQEYNDIIKNVCFENKIEVLDIFGIMDEKDLPDGLHPNSKGHEKIYKEVYKFLKKEFNGKI